MDKTILDRFSEQMITLHQRLADAYKVDTEGGLHIGDFEKSDDGYYVFWPFRHGYWEENILLCIANKLKELNKPWDDQIKEMDAYYSVRVDR